MSKKTKSHPKKIGRPCEYTEEVAAKLCLAISTSTKGLRRICAENAGFPNPSTIYNWIVSIPAFHARYARAREFQAQALFDELIELADKPRMGIVTKVDHRGRKAKRIADMTDRCRLQIDVRKWALSKLLPKKYGDKLELAAEGDDPLVKLCDGMSAFYRAKYGHLSSPESLTESKKPDDEEIVQ